MMFDESVYTKLVPSTPDTHVLREKKHLVVYIAALWSVQCRTFTSELVDAYRQKSDNCPTEVDFISLDRTLDDYHRHCEQMPWLLVPYDASFRYRLLDSCTVDTLPSIFVFDEMGRMVSRNDFAGYAHLFLAG